MSELVLLHHNEPMTTSLAIAEGVQLQHKNIVALIRKHAEPLLSFGSLAFETRVMRQDGRGGELGDVYFLNEPQSTLLITFMRNSEIVIAFKIALVKAFFELRARVTDTQSGQPDLHHLDTFPSHLADRLVAADRTFRAMMRTCRAAGMRLPQALSRANAITTQRTGVDILAELDIDPAATAEPIQRKQEDPLDDALRAWVSCQTNAFSLNDAAIRGLGLDATKLSRELQTRIGISLRKLGCRRVEKRHAKIRYWYIAPGGGHE